MARGDTNLAELKRQEAKVKALLNTVKAGVNAGTALGVRQKIYAKWNKMGDIFNKLSGGPNGPEASKVMNNTRRMMGP